GLASLGLRQGVAADELLVAGQHLVAVAALAGVAQARFGDPLHRDRDDLLALHVAEVALANGADHRLLDRGLGQPDEALPVRQALSFRIEPPVDDIHDHGGQPALSTRMYHSTRRRVWRLV